jgi:hypothetical protein
VIIAISTPAMASRVAATAIAFPTAIGCISTSQSSLFGI